MSPGEGRYIPEILRSNQLIAEELEEEENEIENGRDNFAVFISIQHLESDWFVQLTTNEGKFSSVHHRLFLQLGSSTDTHVPIRRGSAMLSSEGTNGTDNRTGKMKHENYN